MKLWLISQDANGGYDTYDSAVVVAEDAEEARATHPSGNNKCWKDQSPFGTWCERPDQVSVKLLGNADMKLAPGVILASFNAG